MYTKRTEGLWELQLQRLFRVVAFLATRIMTTVFYRNHGYLLKYHNTDC